MFFAAVVGIVTLGLAGCFMVAADPDNLREDLVAARDFFISPWMIASEALVVALIAFGIWELRHPPGPLADPTNVAPLLRAQRRRLVVAYVLFALGLSLIGVLYAHDLRESALAQSRTQISGVARLKAQQIDKWLYERSLDTEFLGNSLQALSLDSWASDTHTRNIIDLLLADALVSHDERVAIALFDGRGGLLASAGQDFSYGSVLEKLRIHAPTKGKIRIFPLRPSSGPDDRTILCFLYPIVDATRTDELRALVAITIDPGLDLTKSLNRWPTDSTSGEVIVVRREGDHAAHVVMPEKGRAHGVPMNIPLTNRQLPSVAALLDGDGFREGVDLAGHVILSASATVKSLGWVVIAKEDRDEILSDTAVRTRVLTAVIFGTILAAGALILALWRGQRSDIEGYGREQEHTRNVLNRHYQRMFRAARDVALLVREDGTIADANNAALAVYGYSTDEMVGMHVRDLRPQNATAPFEEQWRRAGLEQGFLFETLHQRKNGSVFPVEVGSAPIEVDGRKYRQSFIRDISKRKALEAEVVRLSRVKRALFEAADVVMHAASESALFGDVCKAIVEFAGYRLVAIHLPVDGADKTVSLAAAAGEAIDYTKEIRVTWDGAEHSQGPIGTALRTGEIEVNQDFVTNERMAPWRSQAIKYRLGASVALPFRVRGKISGTLALYSSEPNAFDHEEVEMLRHFADDIGYGIERLRDKAERDRAERELVRLARIQQALFRATSALLHATSETQMFEDICRVVTEIAGYQLASVGMPEDGPEKAVRFVTVVGEAGAYIREAKVTWDDSQYAQGATGSALRTGEIQVIPDFASNPRVAHWADIAKKFGLEACVGLPLRVDGKVFAALTVYSSQKDAFDKAELAMLERFAEDISFGVQVVRRKEERDRYEQQVARLSRFQGALLNAHAAMVRAPSEQEIYEGICKVIVENAGYLVAGIGLVQKHAVPAIRPVAVAGGGAHTAEIVQLALMRAREADGSGPVGQAVQSGKVQVIRHRSTDPRLDPWRPRLAALGVTIGATAALPLKRGDEVFGVLAVFSTIEHDFLDDEIVMLESFADDIAFYVDVLRRDGAPS